MQDPAPPRHSVVALDCQTELHSPGYAESQAAVNLSPSGSARHNDTFTYTYRLVQYTVCVHTLELLHTQICVGPSELLVGVSSCSGCLYGLVRWVPFFTFLNLLTSVPHVLVYLCFFHVLDPLYGLSLRINHQRPPDSHVIVNNSTPYIHVCVLHAYRLASTPGRPALGSRLYTNIH